MEPSGSLSEDEMVGLEVVQCYDEDAVQYNEEDAAQYNVETAQMECVDAEVLRPEKRKGCENEWTVVKSKEKKQKPEVEKIEMYISCSEQLPKQFALAKLFKDNNITDIQRVKYVSPFKVRLDMRNELSADRLENCRQITDKGWQVHRAMEKNLSYGVIRDVDLEMSDEEVFNRISCPKPAQLVSIFRLNRRGSSQGWTRSETVRLCFKGAFLPSYISVDGLRIRVDPYVFPVSQCSRCWKLGHMAKRCPSSKVVCPKCSENHDNCETTSFKCVNCDGVHMAMHKGCPAFLKEKKLREIMAEFNCTYRKALTIYVTPSSPTDFVPKIFTFAPTPRSVSLFPPLERRVPSSLCDFLAPEADAIHTRGDEQVKPSPRPAPKKQRRRKTADPFQCEPSPNTVRQETSGDTELGQDIPVDQKKEKEVNFSELFNRLKEIIFLRGDSIQSKVKNILKCCVEWLILVVVDNVTDWPILKQILDFFMNYG